MRYVLSRQGGPDLGVEGDRFAHAHGSFDFRLELGEGELRPGLINAHDHLHRNHYPRLGRPPYPDSYVWGSDIHEHDSEVIERARRVDRREALLFGALKNLMSGVTTVVHHDPWEEEFERDFPVRVARVRTLHSLGIDGSKVAALQRAMDEPLCIHLAEGTTPQAAEEVREAERNGLLDRSVLAVHVVGADGDGIERLICRGVTVVWCPSSNDWLFQRTAPRQLIAGARVVLGSDSLLTAAGTLLDELRFARRTGLLEDDRLLQAVSLLAAEALAVAPPTLSPGADADFVLFRRPVLEATCEDVDLVIVGGVPRLASPRYSELFDRMSVPNEPLQVGRVTKLVASPLPSIASRIVSEWPDCGRIFRPPAEVSPHGS